MNNKSNFRLEPDVLLQIYTTMRRIRTFEDMTDELFKKGIVKGTAHSYVGEEAIASGVCTALNKGDYIASYHRGHGHCIAKGADLGRMMAELFGRKDGYCQGLGGSMHLCDPRVGLFPTFAIVGAGIPVAAGAGLTAQVLDQDDVAIACFGDGAANIGAFHEGLNLASVWELPVVFVCENNLYGEYTRIDDTTPIDDIASRADAYGMPGIIVDGQDVDVVEAAVSSALDKARAGGGPTLRPRCHRAPPFSPPGGGRTPVRRVET